MQIGALRGLHDRLVELEFAVASTTDPDQTLIWLASHQPHVFFIDFEMPRLPGPEIVDRIRATTAGAEVPIVATGSRVGTDLPSGVAAWLAPPMRAADLLQALEQALDASPEARRTEPPRRRESQEDLAAALVPLTLYGDDGRFGVEIESCQPTGMRVLSRDRSLPLGVVFKAQVPWKDGRVRLTVKVDSVTQADDGWHCGLAVKSAEPPHWWRRFVAQRSS
jgi:CheY-like chemotaxis protein